VDVVADGINFNQLQVMVLEDAGDVGVKVAALFIAQELTPTFRTEHEVNDDIGERLGQERAALTGLWTFSTAVYPGLQPGLSHCRPSALWPPAAH
jgi:hypothetical protein